MKTLVSVLSFVLVAQFAFVPKTQATDGRVAECFDVGALFPKKYTNAGPEGELILKTDIMVCTSLKNVVYDSDGLRGTADINVRIFKAGRETALYTFGAIESEGALGKTFTTFAKTKADLEIAGSSGERGHVMTFAMRNDHLHKGQIAGYLEMGATHYFLIQR